MQGEAVGDGLLVVADADGERAQAGLVVGFHGGEPGFEVAAAGAGGHHFGEGGHVRGERVDVGAAGADGLELGLLAGLEVVGAGQQPAGDLAGLRDCRGRGRGGECVPEWPDVAADGLRAAGPAAFSQFGVERGGVGEALVPSLADVRLELIQLRFPAGGLAQQFLGAAGAGEPLHGLAVQSGDAADRGQRFAGVQPPVDLGVAFPGACHQAALPAARVQGPGRRDLRACSLPRRVVLWRVRNTRRVVAGGVAVAGLVLQAAAMASHRLLGVFGQVVPQMPAIGDLDRVRRARPGALGVVAGPVPADDSRAGMRRQPRLQAGGLPVRQQVDHVPGAHVYQHRPVHLAPGQREVIDPEHLRRGRDLRLRRRRDQPQHRRGVHGDPEGAGQPGGRAAGQLQPEPGQHPQQRDAAPPVPLAQPHGLLGEGDRRAGRVPAAEPAHLQHDQHRPPARRAVSHHPRIPAVHPRRLLTAPRAARHLRPARRDDHHRVPGVFHPVHAQSRQVREQHGQQRLPLLTDIPDDAGGGAGRPGRQHGRLIRQRGSRVQ
ncbi:MAG TPA: hypothetical protein VG123_06700 [Streptosporangiaceae bacterium]|nr:hypothetical protein [Streptosporangiaceae bacterium]